MLLGRVRALLLMSVALAGSPLCAQDLWVVRAGHLWDGSTILTGQRLVVRRGVIEALEPDIGDLPAGARVVDARDGWVLPGLWLADSTTLAPGRDLPENLTPHVRAVDGFDPFVPRDELLRAGVTRAYVSPGRQRFLPGQGGVVNLSRTDPGDVIVDVLPSVHVVMDASVYAVPPVYRPPLAPGPDDPILPMERQLPSSRGGALALLRSLLDQEKKLDDVDLRPLQSIVRGQALMRVRADLLPDITGALDIAAARGLRLVVEGGREAWKVADELSKAKAIVVLRSGVRPGGELPLPEPFTASSGRDKASAPAILASAGVEVALVPPDGGKPEDLLWYAGRSRTAGFTDEHVLRAVTTSAARACGAKAPDAGSLRTGLSDMSDFVVFGGHPFGAGARPLLVMSGGRAFEASAEEPCVAISAARIHTADGAPIEGGTIVVRGGKIVALGREVAIPRGARRIDLPWADIVPGFIDARGQVGLRAYKDLGDGERGPGSPLPTLELGESPVDFFDDAFPDVRAAAESGVTTVVLSPAGGKPQSGPLAIVKTAGPGVGSVLQRWAGLLLDYTSASFSPALLKTLRTQFTAGQKYAKGWSDHRKALAEWHKKNPAEVKKASAREGISPKTPVPWEPWTGSWQGYYQDSKMPDRRLACFCRLKVKGAKVEVALSGEEFSEELTFEGELNDLTASFELSIGGEKGKGSATVGREEMWGTYTWEQGAPLAFWLMRTERDKPEPEGDPSPPEKSEKKGSDVSSASSSPAPEKPKGAEKPQGSATAEGTGPPKEPATVKAMEPYRALFEQEGQVFLAVKSARLAREIVRVLRDEFEVRTVVVTQDLVPRLADTMSRHGVGLTVSGEWVRREAGRRIDPVGEMLSRKLPVVLESRPGGDARGLYSNACYAVREGVAPGDALKMLTRWSALVLGLDERLGRLKEGYDADLAIVEGGLFGAGSRVVRVMVGGKFVDEAEQAR